MYIPRNIPPEQSWIDRIRPPWSVEGPSPRTPVIRPDAESNMPVYDLNPQSRDFGDLGRGETNRFNMQPAAHLAEGPSGQTESVQLVDAISRLLSGRNGMSPESVREPGPSLPEQGAPIQQPWQNQDTSGARPIPAQSGLSLLAIRPFIQGVANVIRPVDQRPMQIDPSVYLEQYGRAKDRITKELGRGASLADIAQAFGSAQGQGKDFGSTLNALRAAKIKEQMQTYEMERDYAKTGIAAQKAQYGQDPAAVAAFKFGEGLSPEDRERFLPFVRAPQSANLGDRVVITQPGGGPATTLQKGVPPQDQPGHKGAVAKEQELGKTAAERTMERPKAEAALANELAQLAEYNRQITELGDHTGLSGITGSVLGRLPEVAQAGRGDASNAQALLNSITAKAADLKLQMYRAAARTGTPGIGQITEREWPRFERMIAALGQEQDTKTFKRRLGELQAFIVNFEAIIKDQFEQTYGGGAGQQTPTPSAPRVIDFNQLPPG